MVHQICLFPVCILCAALWQSLRLGSQEGGCLFALCWLCWGMPEDEGDDTLPGGLSVSGKSLWSHVVKSRGRFLCRARCKPAVRVETGTPESMVSQSFLLEK